MHVNYVEDHITVQIRDGPSKGTLLKIPKREYESLFFSDKVARATALAHYWAFQHPDAAVPSLTNLAAWNIGWPGEYVIFENGSIEGGEHHTTDGYTVTYEMGDTTEMTVWVESTQTGTFDTRLIYEITVASNLGPLTFRNRFANNLWTVEDVEGIASELLVVDALLQLQISTGGNTFLDQTPTLEIMLPLTLVK
jgi:hypothetical protein